MAFGNALGNSLARNHKPEAAAANNQQNELLAFDQRYAASMNTGGLAPGESYDMISRSDWDFALALNSGNIPSDWIHDQPEVGASLDVWVDYASRATLDQFREAAVYANEDPAGLLLATSLFSEGEMTPELYEGYRGWIHDVYPYDTRGPGRVGDKLARTTMEGILSGIYSDGGLQGTEGSDYFEDYRHLWTLGASEARSGMWEIVGDVLGAASPVAGLSALKNSKLLRLKGAAAEPRFTPKINANGVVRSPDEAIRLAEKHGVHIPHDDVEIVFMKWNRKDANAEYFDVGNGFYTGSEKIAWDDFVMQHGPYEGKLVVRVNEGILNSDEAIVSTLGHEMHEVNAIIKMFDQRDRIPVAEIARQINTRKNGGLKNNLHEQAWDVSDRLIKLMRGQ